MKKSLKHTILAGLICLATLLCISACHRKHVQGKSQQLHTIQQLPQDGPLDSLARKNPKLTKGKHYAILNTKVPDATIQKDAKINRLKSKQINNEGRYYKKQQPKQNGPGQTKELEIPDTGWKLGSTIIILIYVLAAFTASLLWGFTGLMISLLALSPLAIAAYIVYCEARRLRLKYDVEVRNKTQKENRYINLKIAARAILNTFLYVLLFVLFITLLLAATEALDEDAGLIILGGIYLFLLLLLIIAVVLSIIYSLKKNKHKQAGSKEEEVSDPPYTFINAPWHTIALIFTAFFELLILSAGSQVSLLIPLFALAFMLSLGQKGEFTIYTRIILALGSIGLFIGYLSIFKVNYIWAILDLVVILCTIFFVPQRKNIEDKKNYQSMRRAFKNIGLMALLFIATFLLFPEPDLFIDLYDIVFDILTCSLYMFIGVFIALLIKYLI